MGMVIKQNQPQHSCPNRNENIRQGKFKSVSELKTLLCKAAREGRHQDVLKLIQQGATFQPCGPVGYNPLHLAAMNGHLEVCTVLLNFKILIDTQDMVDKTALHMAATNGHTEIVELLLSKGATVDVDDMLRMTPLHWACDRGHYQIASLLLTNGANPDKRNKFQKSPRYLAVEKNYSRIVNLMEDKRNSSPKPESEPRTEASEVHSDTSSDSGLLTNRSSQSNSEESLPTLSAEVIHTEEEEENSESLENLLNRSCDLNNDVEDDLQDDLLKSLDELEACSFNNLDLDRERATAELLSIEAALLTIDDPLRELRRAVSLGHTIKLTEAGKMAFSMTVPDPFIIPYEENSKRKERERSPAMQARNSECSTVALRSQSISELYNELTESCNFEVPTCRSPSSKRYKK